MSERDVYFGIICR